MTGINSKIKHASVCFSVVKITAHLFTHIESQPAPVRSGFESKLMENVFLSCEKEFLSKEFKARAAKFKGNATFLEKFGIRELISNPDVTIIMQDKSKQLVVILY